METRLVIFDCDGVLVDSEGLQLQAYSEVLRPLGAELDIAEGMELFAGKSLDEVVAIVKEKFRVPLPEDFAELYRTRMRELFRRELKPVEGIVDVLENLEVPKCVASNGPQNKMDLTLQITGLDRFFEKEWIFSAYDIDSFKPEPDLYLHAAKQSGVAPESCVVLEDSAPGLTAALAAGMKTVFYSESGNFTRARELGAHVCIDHMSQFLKVLQEEI